MSNTRKPKGWICLPDQMEHMDSMVTLPESVVGKLGISRRPSTKISIPTIAYNKGGNIRRGDFQKPEYNLSEIAKAADTEAYLRLSFELHKIRILKEGWFLQGRNDSTVAYILTRLREIELATNVPFDLVLRQVVRNLVVFGNAFLVTHRDSDRSSGEHTRRYGRRLAPIAGIFSADPTSMEVKKDQHGNIQEWRQYIPGTGERKFRKENVIHITYERKDGFVFGTPFAIPALDDIRALRRLEELVELLLNKHIFPLFHYKVGTPEMPAEEYDNGVSEVDLVRNEVQAMPTEGAIVTPERHEIVAVSADPIDARPFLDYFESRVMTGLHISAVDSGRGDTANRATAGFLSRAKDDQAKDMQDVLSTFLNSFFFDELLEEGSFPLTEENRVRFCWPPIDPEEKRLRDNHAMLMYQSSLVTEDEARMMMGKQPFLEEQRAKTFYEMQTVRSAELQGELALKAKAAQTGPQNQVTNRNQPTNQSGTKTAKTKPKNDAMDTRFEVLWNRLRSEIQSTDADFRKRSVEEFVDSVVKSIGSLVIVHIEDGMDQYSVDYAIEKQVYAGLGIKNAYLSQIRNRLGLVADNMLRVIESYKDKDKLLSFDVHKPSFVQLLDNLDKNAAAFGYQILGSLSVDATSDQEIVDSALTWRESTEDDQVEIDQVDGVGGDLEVDYDIWALGHIVWKIHKAGISDKLDLTPGKDGLDPMDAMEKFLDAKIGTKERASLESDTCCGPGKSFPVNDCAHYTAALRIIDRFKGESDKGRIRSCITRRGTSLGCPGTKSNK